MTLRKATRLHSRFRKLVENDRHWSDASHFCDMFGAHWLKISDETEIAQLSLSRLQRVERAIGAQKSYVNRAGDPDTRYRAEGNLIRLVLARNELRELVLTLRSRMGAAHVT